MIASSDVSHDDERGTLLARLPAEAVTVEEGETFTRVDLVFFGVDHSKDSYEVRVFLNNPKATADTPRTPDEGYAGRFVIFGHGGCFGGTGHCDPPTEPRERYDLRLPHQLTPQDKLVTVTDAVRRLRVDGPSDQISVTLVPVSKDAVLDRRGSAPQLFKFEGLELRTYLSEDEVEDEDALV